MRAETDVLVVGGGTGGVAAAIAATRNGWNTILLEETDWLGGQLTSQGVSAPDAHPYIETVLTDSFRAFRGLVRDYYRLGFRLSPAAQSAEYLNPGNGWVSWLCYEPKVGVEAINQLLKPAIDSGKLTVLYNAVVTSVTMSGADVKEVRVVQRDGTTSRELAIKPRYVVEAGELGDFLVMAHIPFSIGLDSQKDTGEPDAYQGDADPDHVQSFTFCFAIEKRPTGEKHTIPRPPDYEKYRDKQPFDLEGFPMFTSVPDGKLPFWTYRRLIDASNFNDPRYPNDIAMINWPGNDYYGADIVNIPAESRPAVLQDAKNLALSFLYWLQTECPREDGGKGYPEFKLRYDVMGTTDGLSKYPYIREGRRIKALKTVYENDLVTTANPHARAKLQDDTAGVGWYMVDIHKCVGGKKPAEVTGGIPTKPFQIPLGCLIPKGGGNVLAGAKNLGVTHVTNGSYRLHPVEWNTGESAGTLASFCLENKVSPADVWKDKTLTRRYQRVLLSQGIPIFWFADLPPGHPLFEKAQLLAVEKGWIPDQEDINFVPDKKLTDADRSELKKLGVEVPAAAVTRGDVARSYK